MKSNCLSSTDSIKVCEISENSSETRDDSEGLEETDNLSVGKLQHDIKMLSIKVFEKDMKIKELMAESTAAKKSKFVRA
ncbi:unnamed protein product [Taenia asiatica]|uniref:RPAP1_N domain-containing protein n=1 Tax=Taenia asiatica TaxID=60517 RepID=A0A0R3W1Q6_TAEAS|nr:unnamed protein product [Taenia asiatica]